MIADLATRGGQRVVAFDLFGDLDLRRSASRVVTPAELGGGGLRALVDAAAKEPASGVVYGAGFENHPALVARLASLLASRPCQRHLRAPHHQRTLLGFRLTQPN